MAKASNTVVDGNFKGKQILSTKDCAYIKSGFKKIFLTPDNVISYSLVTQDMQKSATSGVAKGLVGNFLLGPIGLIAGGVSGKNVGIYRIVIIFVDNSQSLLEVDDNLYKLIVQRLAFVNNAPTTINDPSQLQGQTTTQQPQISIADELLKFKQLLDAGAITQEEYDEQKSLLLQKKANG